MFLRHGLATMTVIVGGGGANKQKEKINIDMNTQLFSSWSKHMKGSK